ncbi:MAG: hypothetical protein ABIR39_13300 [Nocardioides sp.]|uniref:hypothetical protein n=1 Tax=Nocardioides sp. TaxID=35761 RepID=UPI00326769A6
MSEFYVEFAVMEGSSEDQMSARDSVLDVEKERAGATIPHGSLGTIVDAEAIQSAFDDATQATQETLDAMAEACTSTSDLLDALKTYFIAVDENVAERFDALAGGAS